MIGLGVVSIATSYAMDGLGFEFRQVLEILSFPKRSKPALGPMWCSGRAMNLTAHLDLVRRVRTSGTISLLPIYAFMAGTGTTFTLLVRGFSSLSVELYHSLSSCYMFPPLDPVISWMTQSTSSNILILGPV